MYADKEKLKNATIEELRREIALIDEEMHESVDPISYDRYMSLNDYRLELSEELKRRLKCTNT